MFALNYNERGCTAEGSLSVDDEVRLWFPTRAALAPLLKENRHLGKNVEPIVSERFKERQHEPRFDGRLIRGGSTRNRCPEFVDYL